MNKYEENDEQEGGEVGKEDEAEEEKNKKI